MACEYCEGSIHKDIFEEGCSQAFVTTDSSLYFEYHGIDQQEYVDVQINYCPMCGRKLCDTDGMEG